ncbi:MAG: hypothetical protein KME19_10945 [Microcoleus vaginatus WJT46-NPBG5]|nr:hypothetical protein [Microcoleus vaginatus WJT46-NPBG5]
MQLKVKTKEIPNWLQKFCVLDTEAIIEILQKKQFCDCDRMPTSEVKYALTQWFKSLVDSIEADPDWFINAHCSKHFTQHLPEPFDVEEFDSGAWTQSIDDE